MHYAEKTKIELIVDERNYQKGKDFLVVLLWIGLERTIRLLKNSDLYWSKVATYLCRNRY